MKVTKRVKLVSVKPAGDGLRYALLSSDGEWYSTFDSKVGKYIESVGEGDTVEIEYIQNAKGFKNFSSIKLVENGELPEEPPEEEERREEKSPKPTTQRRGIDRIDKNCISAMQGALKYLELEADCKDHKQYTVKELWQRYMALWNLHEERIDEGRKR